MSRCTLCPVIFLLIILPAELHPAAAQTFTRHIVYLKNKANTPYSFSNPQAFLSQRALERRQRYQIPLDSTDLPVNPHYITTIAQSGNVTVLGASRWSNAVLVQCSDATLPTINALAFVQSTQSVALRQAAGRKRPDLPVPYRTDQVNSASSLNYGAGTAQLQLHHGTWLHQLGATGHNVHIAVIDAGFASFNANPLLDSVLLQNRIAGTWDFVSGHAQVADDHPHGLNCFTILAANSPGTLVGAAPHATYHLLRSEDAATEYPIEEFYWGLAAEYADSAGVDVISSSLGYYDFDNPVFNYTYAQMNGRTTLISRFAALAARKGMLVVTSAGNEGNNSWKYIVAPADADSVLSVGAVNASGVIAPFSSYGPTADGRIKPDAVALGWGTAAGTTTGTVAFVSGTSFAAPVLAGIAACLWQLFPENNNVAVLQALRKAGNRYATPDAQYGFGLPDMRAAMAILLQQQAQLQASIVSCNLQLSWRSKDAAGMQYLLQSRNASTENWNTIATLPVATPDFQLRTYSQTTPLPGNTGGALHVRLVQVLDSNQSSYFALPLDSLTLSIPAGCTPTALSYNLGGMPENMKVIPNPGTTLALQFSTPQNGILQVQVLDVNGRILLQQVQQVRDSRLLQIPTPQLAPGHYRVQVFRNNRLLARASWMKL
ncbi:MAG: S8 family peptidase [Lacibacter sp.]